MNTRPQIGRERSDTLFWAKVEQGTIDDCWPWTAFRDFDGYGKFKVGSGYMPAHRYAWEFANDTPIPYGKLVCHKCDNTWCCNPNHLFLGVSGDNIQDMIDKGRKRVAGHINLTAALMSLVTTAYAKGESITSMAKQLKTTRQAIRRILKKAEVYNG
jgi:hypothetical protein